MGRCTKGSTKGMSDVQFVNGGIDVQVVVQIERAKSGRDDAQVDEQKSDAMEELMYKWMYKLGQRKRAKTGRDDVQVDVQEE